MFLQPFIASVGSPRRHHGDASGIMKQNKLYDAKGKHSNIIENKEF